MKTIFLVFSLIWLQGNALAKEDRTMEIKCEVDLENQNTVCVNGEIQRIIGIIFKDFSDLLKGQVKDIKYYNFVVAKEGSDEITIQIRVNNKKVLRDYGHMMKGGGGLYRYSIVKDEIVNRAYTK